MPLSKTGWDEFTIGQLGRVITGKTPPTKRSELYGQVYPFITPSDIDNRNYVVRTERFLSEEGCRFQRDLLLPARSVCVVCIASIGKICMSTYPSFTNQQINSVVVLENQHDPFFVYYVLKNALPRLRAIAGGVATPISNKGIFSEMKLSVPPLPTQRKIAGILSAYDHLIENNTRRIAILEEMAQAIYREWFVHFRFPGHESVRMVDSELGKIPEGWEVVKDGDLYATASGGTPNRKVSSYYGGNIPWVKTRELHDRYILDTEERITDLGLRKSSARVFPENTVLIAMYGATIGRLGIVAQLSATNQACCALLPKIPAFGHSYAFSMLLNIRDKLVSLGQGAAQQNISQAVIKGFPSLKPRENLVRQFSELVDPMLELVRNLQARNANLRQTRDLLLPRLVSGEVDVSDLDVGVGELWTANGAK